ncbi:MAG: hypothetical protein U0556_06965 [Dehalococcoidia bacterium]
MNAQDLIGLAGVPVIVALVQVFKPFVADSRFYPPIALGMGLLLNLGAAFLLDADPQRAALAGIVAGLAAAGLYDQGRALAVR